MNFTQEQITEILQDVANKKNAFTAIAKQFQKMGFIMGFNAINAPHVVVDLQEGLE